MWRTRINIALFRLAPAIWGIFSLTMHFGFNGCFAVVTTILNIGIIEKTGLNLSLSCVVDNTITKMTFPSSVVVEFYSKTFLW